MAHKSIEQDRKDLLDWYDQNKRELPWRANRDPYRIWISEIMLQQTRVQAVVPYFERFMTHFPNVKALARAPLEKVLEQWAGLGYYSRARNLHAAAKILAKTSFAQTYQELMELPGLGPYTARAISSIAFNEPVGVVDGNVIRVLSRRYKIAHPHWTPTGREKFQIEADQLASSPRAADVNQALMELGATVCTPTSPTCVLCPWAKVCFARKAGEIAKFPSKKPRRKTEIWVWQPQICNRQNQILFVRNDYAPFLRGQWLLPGTAKKVNRAPKKFAYQHAITHHQIFVLAPKRQRSGKRVGADVMWAQVGQIKKQVPTSLVRKALEHKAVK